MGNGVLLRGEEGETIVVVSHTLAVEDESAWKVSERVVPSGERAEASGSGHPATAGVAVPGGARV